MSSMIRKASSEILRSRINNLILPQALPPTPANYPYTIEDDPECDFFLTLKREIGNEKTEIELRMPDKFRRKDCTLEIKVSRENGSTLRFSLDGKAFGKDLEITIMSVHPASKSYDFDSYVKELWPDVYEALKKYLEIKYIKVLDLDFLNKYMIINKHNRLAREELMLLTQLEFDFDAISKEEVLENHDDEHKKNFSSVVDPNPEIKIVEEKLNEILRSRLETAVLFPRAMPPTPANFPFTCFPGIILKREIGSEKIEIEVWMYMNRNVPRLGNMMEEISGVDSFDDDNHPSKNPWRYSMKVSRENGSALTIDVKDFEKGYEIQRIILPEKEKEENVLAPRWDRWDRWPIVQEALRKYVEIRGLKEIDYDFLKEYKQACVARHQLYLLSEFLKGGKDVDGEQDFLKNHADEHKETLSVEPNSEEIKMVDEQLYESLESQRLEITKLYPTAMPPTPANYPFTIEDSSPNSYNTKLTLKREIGSEKIEIKVEDNYQYLKVKVSRENGSALTFHIGGYEKPEYEIYGISVHEVGSDPEYSKYLKLDEDSTLSDVQEAFRKYLDIRGMKEIDYGFLKECMDTIKNKHELPEELLILSKFEQFLKGSGHIC